MDKAQYEAVMEQRRLKAAGMNQNLMAASVIPVSTMDRRLDNLGQVQDFQLSTTLIDTSNALYKIPVFLSYATPFNSTQALFLERVIEEIRATLLFPRTLGRSDQYTETPLTAIRQMVISSYGLMAIAFRRAFVERAISRPGTPIEQTFENFWLSSPYLQIEPSMAYQQGLPVTIFVENGVSMNGVFGGILQLGAGPFNIITFDANNPQDVTNFFNSVNWRETFVDWVGEVRACYNKRTQPTYKCNCQC